ncbi:MAG: glycosyltransferase [Acidobacteriota bacterium]
MALKILFLTQTYPRFDGDTAGPFIRDLARGLVRGGDEVTVLAPHAEGVKASWDDDGVAVETFRYAPESLELVGYSRSLKKDEGMRIGAAVSAPLYWWGAHRALSRHLRQGQGQRHGSFDVLQAHWVVPNGLPAASFGKRLAVLAGLHGSDVFMAEKLWLRGRVGKALSRCQGLTGCSPELVDRVAALGFSRDDARVIPYGVDVELFHPVESLEDEGRRQWREQLGIPADAPMILSVGRMATKKGFHVLVPALGPLMEKHPEAHLVLAGGGDRLEELRQAARLWADRVHFPGAVYRDTLPDLYRAADLFILPAVHDPAGNVDGLPNVILEAMATGLPVVASAISGIPLAVEEGVTGALIPEQDGEAAVAALDRLLQDLDRARDLGAAGRRKATSQLTWDAVAARYREAYVEAQERFTAGRKR